MRFLVYQKQGFHVLKFTIQIPVLEINYLIYLPTSTYCSSSLSFTISILSTRILRTRVIVTSHKRITYQIKVPIFKFSNCEINVISHKEIIYDFLHTCKASGTFANSSSTSIFTFGIYTTRILITRIDLAV